MVSLREEDTKSVKWIGLAKRTPIQFTIRSKTSYFLEPRLWHTIYKNIFVVYTGCSTNIYKYLYYNRYFVFVFRGSSVCDATIFEHGLLTTFHPIVQFVQTKIRLLLEILPFLSFMVILKYIFFLVLFWFKKNVVGLLQIEYSNTNNIKKF